MDLFIDVHHALEKNVVLPATAALFVLAILGHTAWWVPLAVLGIWGVLSVAFAAAFIDARRRR